MPTRGFHRSRPVLGAMDAEFEKAKVQLNTLQNEPGNDVKLTIYALFKQATIGKCNVKKPGMMDFVGKAKWDAWNNLSDMTQDEAQKAYIDLVHSLAGEDSPSQASVSSTESAGKYETVAVTLNDGIFKITLNRPAKKNAINYKMYEEVGLALSEAANDKNCTLAVLTVDLCHQGPLERALLDKGATRMCWNQGTEGQSFTRPICSDRHS
ncbi:peroxisomal 3,2-trans-enoyl-CoA isomerase [Mytilus galloprovincialis]|nr:peroxisomal 3,2-trans-enoyl-CoA isomerase [Mytilus galloprovincialis]